MNSDCGSTPGADSLSCPLSKTDEVNGARHAAQIEGPLAIGLAAGAVAALGAGIWMIAGTPHRGVALAPVVTNQGGMLVLTGRLER
jgi:hypothetical protein